MTVCRMQFRQGKVTFAYEEEQPILKEVTVDIPSRSLVSVVGASGCGKSTLASLFMGYQTAQSGKVLDLWQGYSDDPGKGAHETDDACIFPKIICLRGVLEKIC